MILSKRNVGNHDHNDEDLVLDTSNGKLFKYSNEISLFQSHLFGFLLSSDLWSNCSSFLFVSSTASRPAYSRMVRSIRFEVSLKSLGGEEMLGGCFDGGQAGEALMVGLCQEVQEAIIPLRVPTERDTTRCIMLMNIM
jgi:hypothetical protein